VPVGQVIRSALAYACNGKQLFIFFYNPLLVTICANFKDKLRRAFVSRRYDRLS
jgi:hypothetical protein